MNNLNILYEDNHILVVVKPANVLSQGDYTGDQDMVTLLKNYIKEKYNKPGNVYLGLVHRLDRPVGGTMVFAKTSKAASRLSEQIRQRSFKRTYIAVVANGSLKDTDTLVHYLLKDKRRNKVAVVDKETIGAKEAILEYRVLARKSDLSLIEIQLHTGRAHQIRVQLNAIASPIVGDQLYGTRGADKGVQIALWASKIIFMHPTKKEELEFCSMPEKRYPWSLFDL